MSTTSQQLITLFEEYKENNDKFTDKGNKAALLLHFVWLVRSETASA